MDTNLLMKLSECTIACDICADACFDEENVSMMVNCIKTDRDCAAICTLTSSYISRNSKYAEPVIRLCRQVCLDCEKECRKHDHNHCQQCADVCKACAEACEEFLSAMA